MTEYIFTDDFEKVLRRQVAARVADKARVLNIACEHHLVPPALEGLIQPENVFGLEVDRKIVEREEKIHYCDVNVDRFSFDDASFDLVLSVWGMEHFQNDNVFSEVARTLKPGGAFVFLTPNLVHPIFFFNKLFGGRFAQVYYERVMHSKYKPHATYYRFNTLGKIRRTAQAAGFSTTKVTYFGPATILNYFSFSKTAQRMVRGLERLITNRLLYRFKPYLLCVLEK